MALRDKLYERTQQHVGAGETVHQVFMAQTGPSPYWVFLTWFTLFWNKYLIGVVTDQQIVTFKATAFKPSFVKQPPTITRFDRALFGPCSGLWSKIEIAGTRYHVHKRFHKDLAAADATTAQMGIHRTTGDLVPPSAGSDAAVTQQVAGTTTEQAAQLPPAGWFPDPHGGSGQRYWDGTAWTEHTA